MGVETNWSSAVGVCVGTYIVGLLIQLYFSRDGNLSPRNNAEKKGSRKSLETEFERNPLRICEEREKSCRSSKRTRTKWEQTKRGNFLYCLLKLLINFINCRRFWREKCLWRNIQEMVHNKIFNIYQKWTEGGGGERKRKDCDRWMLWSDLEA